MKSTICGIEGANATGTVVVIDVIRAFTTAAHAFAAGAGAIVCVEGLEEARSLRAEHPGSLLTGEERGRRPEGFDFGNEPDGFDGLDLAGATLIQRTSNGTRGLAAARGARHLLAAAAVNAAATVRWVVDHTSGEEVTLVTTGTTTSEDRVTAEHIAAALDGREPDADDLRGAVLTAADEHIALWTSRRDPAALSGFRADVERCAAVDTLGFAMVADPDHAGRPVLRRSADRW